jgi:leucyl-tRNA synthetase
MSPMCPVNYCPDFGTVLANEEVIDGKSERGGFPVIRMPMRQWIFKITAYADAWKRISISSIGRNRPWRCSELDRRSTGVEITFKLAALTNPSMSSRPGSTPSSAAPIAALAPEHPLVKAYVSAKLRKSGRSLCRRSRGQKSDLLRTSLAKEKTGVYLGADAINPINGKEIPIYVADYVLGSLWHGAVMAVPCHDERDYAFALRSTVCR